MTEKFLRDVEYVIAAMKDAGYDPYEQLYAYAITGNETYITRKGDARNLVTNLERNKLLEYILPYITAKNKQEIQ